MSVDIASLALEIDSTSVDKGSKSLDGLTAASERTEKAYTSLAAQQKVLAETAKRAEEQGKAFASGLERQVALHGKSAADALRYDAALLTVSKTERDRINNLISTAEKQAHVDAVMQKNIETARRLSLAVTAAATALALYVRATIDAVDAMNDMHIRTGLAFKDLAAYDLLARQNGTTLEGISQGFKFLGKSMIDNRKELAALGVTSTDTNEAMGQFADVIASINDPALRTTLAMKYLGRAGVDLIPALAGGSAAFEKARKDSAAYGDKLAELAPKADEFNDMMSQLAIQSKAAGMNFTSHLLPGLIGMATWLNDIASGGKRSTEAMEFLTEKTSAFTDLIPQLRIMVGLAERLGPALALAGAGSDQAKRSSKGNISGGAADLAAFDAATAEFMRVREIEQRIRSQEERAKAEKKAADEAAKAAEEFKKHAEAIKMDTKQLGLNEIQQRLVAEAAYAMTLTSDKQRLIVMENASAWAIKKQATLDEAETMKKAEDAYNEWKKASEDARKAIDNSIKSLEDKAAAAEAEVANYGLTNSQIELNIIARLEERRAIDASIDGMEASVSALTAEIAARKRLAGASGSKEALDANKKATEAMQKDWDKMHEQIGQSLTDAIMDGGQNAGELLKNYFKTLVLRPVIQGVVDAGMNAIGLGGGSSSGAGGSALNLLSTGQSLVGAFTGGTASTLGGLVGGSFGAGMQGASLAAGLAGPTTTGATGAMGAGAMAATAIPWVAGALAVASIFGSMFGKNKPAPIEWALIDNVPGGKYPGGNAVWDALSAEGPFSSITTVGQHLTRNGQTRAGLKSQITDPLVALDNVLAGYLSSIEKKRIGNTLVAGNEGEHPWGTADDVMMRRLNRISDAIGGWVDKMFDKTTGNLQSRYEQLAKILAVHSSPVLDKLASEAVRSGKAGSMKVLEELLAAASKSAQNILSSMNATLAALDTVTNFRSSLISIVASIKGEISSESRISTLRAQLSEEANLERQLALAGQIKDLVLDRYKSEHAAIEQSKAAAQEAADVLRSYASGLLVSNLSPLTNSQRLSEAGSQYQELLGRVRSGDVSAAGQLSGAANTYLGEARSYYASSSQYNSIFNSVQGMLSQMGMSAETVSSTSDWQARLLEVDQETLDNLDGLTTLTEDWTLTLENILVDQTKEFEKLGLKLTDIVTNTESLDSRIAMLIDAALATRFEKLSVTVEKSAQTNARAMTNALQTATRA